MKSKRVTLVVAALLTLAFAVGVRGDDGLPLNTGFKVPVVVAGKVLQGKAFIDEARVMRIFYVVNGEVEGPILYTLVRGGDVQPPPVPGPKPPVPTPGKPNKAFLIWETGGSDIGVANLARRSDAWKQEALKQGIRVVVVDKDEAAKAYPEAMKLAVAKGLPALVFARDEVPLGVEKLPKDEAALIDLVKKKGGGQ